MPLKQQYSAVRLHTEKLCQPLTVEDTVPQYVEYASPPKWHLAHTTWFFEEMVLKAYLPGYQPFSAAFGELFNSYYQGVGKPYRRGQRGVISRPGLAEVYAYRAHVDNKMHSILDQQKGEAFNDLVTLGLHHEQQHQELLVTDLKIAFAQNPTFPIYSDEFDEGLNGPSHDKQWLECAAGDYKIGHSGDGFCFDNERAAHWVRLAEYAIDSQLVTNGDYLEFVDAGGYQTFGHWLDEGWAWVESESVRHPMYWHFVDGRWHHFTLNGLQPLALNAPVTHVSYYEANAYAAWRGCRLPTEFEWEAASSNFLWGQRWEWTSSAYQPYPAFKVADGAVGEYNGKFMVNQIVLRGGSVATAAGHSRATYRNFFHPIHQWQYSSIRLAK